ncbi:MAG: sigma-70 family RNA polymerase sigma factor [Phycisphaerales bacterium]|nr:sigma-70 family RNA polymerase sigma factor [Phycisphaerales bacterium]
MAEPTHQPITELLDAVGAGDEGARRELWAVVYSELRRMAGGQMGRDAAGRTLQPTTLVHECYFRLFPDGKGQFANRRHFFAAAANAMRRIRIDDARHRKRLKRDGRRRVELDADTPAGAERDPATELAVDEALGKLERIDPRKAEIVTMRFFADMTINEIAAVLEVSPRTVDNEWRFARAWLHRELGEGT